MGPDHRSDPGPCRVLSLGREPLGQSGRQATERGSRRLSSAVRTTVANCASSVTVSAPRIPAEASRVKKSEPSVATPSASADCWVVTITPPPTPARSAARSGGRGLDGGQHLRQHQRGGGPLCHARPDERPGGRREAAGERGEPERRHADQEEPPSAEHVPEPPAEDEQHGVREPVPGDDQLQQRRSGGQVVVDGGQGDVDDEEVDQGERRPEQHGEQAERAEGGPVVLHDGRAAPVGAGLAGRPGGNGRRRGRGCCTHGTHVRSSLSLVPECLYPGTRTTRQWAAFPRCRRWRCSVHSRLLRVTIGCSCGV